MLVHSLMDGVMYHAMPLTAFLLIAAYLVSADETLFNQRDNGRAVALR